jgi:2-(1,2-epoxy-1,2-dihydrophenyl)acetyl-CoA isomerase
MLLVERAGGIVTVTLNRPERKNAVLPSMWIEIARAFSEIGRRSDDRVVILTGAAGNFCSGVDLTESPGKHALAAMRDVGAASLAVANVPQPTIAKVSGVAVGAGMNMALLCDLVVADTTARFSEIFSRRGLSIDFGGSWILPRRIGLHRAKELTLLGDIIDAERADRIGLVNRVVEPSELDETVEDLARRIAAGPPIALAQSKRLLNESFNRTLAEVVEDEGAAQAVNIATADTAEALAAFLQKRDPVFEGR